MIDTEEYYGGTYPEASEPNMYQFEFEGTIDGYGIVYADTMEQALRKLENNHYEEIIDTWNLKIEKVTKIEK